MRRRPLEGVQLHPGFGDRRASLPIRADLDRVAVQADGEFPVPGARIPANQVPFPTTREEIVAMLVHPDAGIGTLCVYFKSDFAHRKLGQHLLVSFDKRFARVTAGVMQKNKCSSPAGVISLLTTEAGYNVILSGLDSVTSYRPLSAALTNH